MDWLSRDNCCSPTIVRSKRLFRWFGRQAKAAEASEEAWQVFACEFVLPDAEDSPASFAERAIHEAASGSVAGNFGEPEFCVLLRLVAVNRTPVPKAFVDEDGEVEFGENKVGFAGEVAVSPLARDAHGAHESD